MQILGQIGLVGVLPKYVKSNTFMTFLTVLIFFSILSTGQTAALAHMLYSMQGGAFWGLQ